jgi:hypothetical protein
MDWHAYTLGFSTGLWIGPVLGWMLYRLIRWRLYR